MSYVVLARKWRPKTFDDLIGQDYITQTLKNAISTGKIKKRSYKDKGKKRGLRDYVVPILIIGVFFVLIGKET